MVRSPAIPRKEIDPLRLKHFILTIIGICTLPFVIHETRPCSVPVFRYALERWKPDAYKGIFIYRNEISKSDRALLEQLKDAGLNSDFPLNLRIREVDLISFSQEKLEGLLKGPIPEQLPVLAIWYPDQMGETAPLWTLKLTPSIVSALTESPKRRELAENLINGESVVWVFIPSGNEAKDERARKLMRQELDAAASAFAKLPYYVMSGSEQKKLTYGFPILTLSSTDPKERFLLEALLGSEPDLYDHADEPMVFPVFGRGRALGCLFGEYITAENIQGASSFLAGSCSCEVKELNPGVDLLMAAPWDLVVMNSYIADTPLPELTGVMPEPPAAIGQPSVAPDNSKHNSSGLLTAYAITLGSVVVVVAFAGLLLNHRRKRES